MIRRLQRSKTWITIYSLAIVFYRLHSVSPSSYPPCSFFAPFPCRLLNPQNLDHQIQFSSLSCFCPLFFTLFHFSFLDPFSSLLLRFLDAPQTLTKSDSIPLFLYFRSFFLFHFLFAISRLSFSKSALFCFFLSFLLCLSLPFLLFNAF